jgi:predicted nicotinamide N-methyase
LNFSDIQKKHARFAPISVRRFSFGDHVIQLAAPDAPDRLLDDPGIQRLNQADDSMPYWAYCWRSSEVLADFALHTINLQCKSVLELGSGLGLAGVAALVAGANVCFTDNNPAALEFCSTNAELNGFGPDQFRTLRLDWCDLSIDGLDSISGGFDRILGADLLYEARLLLPLARTLERFMAARTVAYLVDPCRSTADAFPDALDQLGLCCEISARDDVDPATQRIVRSRLFRIARR